MGDGKRRVMYNVTARFVPTSSPTLDGEEEPAAAGSTVVRTLAHAAAISDEWLCF